MLDEDVDVVAFVESRDTTEEAGPYQFDEVLKRPVRISAQYMHGCECSVKEKRKSTRNKGDVLGNGRRNSGIHHRRQYILA